MHFLLNSQGRESAQFAFLPFSKRCHKSRENLKIGYPSNTYLNQAHLQEHDTQEGGLGYVKMIQSHFLKVYEDKKEDMAMKT